MAKSKQKKKAQPSRKFLAVYLGTKAAMKKWEKLPAKIRREREAQGMQAWIRWGAKHKRAILDPGAPLGATRRVDRRGARATRNELAAYTVVRAPSHAAAAKIFENHPHFTIFPGEAVEVMECLEIPGM
jgi:hypothetical protein